MTERGPGGLRVGARSIEATAPVAAHDLSGADEWRVLVTLRGTPCSYLRVPSPGVTSGAGIVDAALVRAADEPAAWAQFVETFRRRLGAPAQEPERRSCSVVLCTHRRPGYIAEVLEGLSRLDPPADEIVVVDNDPGDSDCRVPVEQLGARYVREDRRGLDNARNAGLQVARGELVAFIDDDCVPAPGWLRSLPELFDDPMVAVVTGPAFAHALETPAQVRFEDQGGHIRGLHRRTFDWRVLTPIASTRAGAGLNMIFRRSALDGLGQVFPPELDAGTPTESGGDTYALYKVLRAGYRVVYDPATYVFHQHRPDSRSLHRAVRGYGIGLSAVLTKLLLEERELATPTVWYWLWWLYKDAVGRGLTGRADPVEVRIGFDYLLGGLLGARAWLSSRHRLGDGRQSPAGAARSDAPSGRSAPVTAAPNRKQGPAVSVVLTAGTPGALAGCLDGLGRQTLPEGAVEVIVVGDCGPPVAAERARRPVVRYISADAASGSRNSGARAARGDLLLFLDAEAVPEPDLAARHLQSHSSSARDRLVVGYSPPRPRRATLAVLHETLWRHDHFEAKRGAASMTFADVTSSNASLRRRTFERLGGFDGGFERLGGEARDFGVRALQAGVEVVYEHAAIAAREVSTTAREALEAARLEGHGDALLEARHPVVSASLPDPDGRPSVRSHPVSALYILAVRRLDFGWVGIVLDALERLRARRAWLTLFELARSAAYARGVSDGGGRDPAAASGRESLRVELDSDEPIPAPAVAPPLIELTLHGDAVGHVKPVGGQWHRLLADHAAVAAAHRLTELSFERLPPIEESPGGHDLTGTAVILGPARQPGDDRHRDALEAAGAKVDLVDGRRDEPWAPLDLAVRSSTAQVVALPFPGAAPAPGWLAGARLAFDGDRVAAAVGAGAAPGKPPQPLFLGSRRLLRPPYAPVGWPARYLIVRRALYEALGGFDLAAARLGPQGPVVDLLERALDAGYVIAYRETAGLEPQVSGRKWRRAAWDRQQARGGLMLRRARREGGGRGWHWFFSRGLLPLAADLWSSLRGGDPSPARAAGTAAAFLHGCAIEVVADRPRDRRQAPPGGGLSASTPTPPAPRAL